MRGQHVWLNVSQRGTVFVLHFNFTGDRCCSRPTCLFPVQCRRRKADGRHLTPSRKKRLSFRQLAKSGRVRAENRAWYSERGEPRTTREKGRWFVCTQEATVSRCVHRLDSESRHTTAVLVDEKLRGKGHFFLYSVRTDTERSSQTWGKGDILDAASIVVRKRRQTKWLRSVRKPAAEIDSVKE